MLSDYLPNWNAVVLVAFCTVVGALLGITLVGLAIGLGIVLAATWYEEVE